MEEKHEFRPPDNVPDWLVEARKAQQSHVLGSEAVQQASSSVPEWVIEDGLPNSRQGIEAKNTQDRTVWLTRCIAQKQYNCPCCQNAIRIGAEHVLVRIQQPSKRYDHHHYHKPCSYSVVDFAKPHHVFKDNKRNDKQVSKRQARTRNRARRR